MAAAPAREQLTANQAARRTRVLEAAIELASEGGYDAVQMRDVATRAQVALGTIYRYFSSKDELLAAAFVTAIASPDPAVAPWQHEMAAVLVALVSDALSGVGLEERNGIVRVLSWVWFGALLGWVNGWTDVGTVGDELAGAARLLVRPGG